MFAALEFMPEKRRGFSRREKRTECVRVAVRGGAPFLLIRTKKKQGKTDWSAVSRVAGRCAERLLVPESCEIPEGFGIGSYEPSVLPTVLSINAAAAELKKAEKSKRASQRVCVIDRKGAVAAYVTKLVPLAGTVRIVTDAPEKYLDVSRRVMEDCGASLIISDEPGNERYDALADAACLPDKALLILPDEIERLRPQGIDSFDFACALFELCGVRSLAHLQFNEQGE